VTDAEPSLTVDHDSVYKGQKYVHGSKNEETGWFIFMIFQDLGLIP